MTEAADLSVHLSVHPSAGPAAVPARPPRDTRLDIIRGWLQLTIFASHASGSFIGGWMIHGSWGLSDSSEQFVFLSGFTLGSVFARRTAQHGWAGAARDMLRRAVRLYRTQLVVFGLFGSMVILAGRTRWFPQEAQHLGWGWVLHDPLHALPAALTMLYQPQWMDILPVFIWCMALLPGFAALEARAGNWALAAPVAVYAASWLGGLWPPALGPDTGIGFNPFAWQLLFLLGAWLGRRALLYRRALPSARWVTMLAVAVLLVGLALRLDWYGFVRWGAPVAEGPLITGKEGLALPRVIHALALAWVVSTLVPREADWMHTPVFRWMAAGGRHSLQVFCLGLFLSWGATSAFRLAPPVWWLDPLLIVSGSVVLLIFARTLDQRREVRRVAVPA